MMPIETGLGSSQPRPLSAFLFGVSAMDIFQWIDLAALLLKAILALNGYI
jgi:hypothetical protein